MSYKQLDLFQEVGTHESNIFEQAKKIKELAQKIFNNLNLLTYNASDLIRDKYCVLKIKVRIELIGDKEKPEEPSTPKVFIWQFIPTIELINEDNETLLLKGGDSFNDNIGPKMIPKWLNSLFTPKIFSKAEFKNITKHYFTLELIQKILKDEQFLTVLRKAIGSKPLIIYFDSKLFPEDSTSYSDYTARDMLNKIINYYTTLKNLQENNWFFVGKYSDFTNKSDLLAELDRNPKIEKSVRDALKISYESQIFNSLFQNDYLFLNNSDFFEENCNTHGWDSNCIVSSDILDDSMSKVMENKLFKILAPGSDEEDPGRRDFISYLKEGDKNFCRSEILFPKVNLTSNILLEVLCIAQKLSNEYNEE